MGSFFNWAVLHERNHCAKLISCQPEYHTNHKNVIMSSRSYGEDGRQTTFVYTPEEGNGYSIVNIHGGGLIAGNCLQNHNFCMSLAEIGYTVYAIEYRLIPEVTFDDQKTDVIMGLCDLLPLLDETKNFLIADSAGCFLAMYALEYTDKVFDCVWFNAPMFEINRLLRRGLFGKGWKADCYAEAIKHPYKCFKNILPENIWITTTKEDDLKKQAIKGARAWFNTRLEEFDYGDHDYNVINAHEYECQKFNRAILDKMMEA